MNPNSPARTDRNCMARSNVVALRAPAAMTYECFSNSKQLNQLGNALYRLFWILSAPLICLVLVNLALAAPGSSKADRSEAKATLKSRAGQEEVLAEVRAALEKKIFKELVTLPTYNVFDNLNFRLDENDIVTLSGQVHLPSLKVSAERVVSNIEGVRSVVNELEVLPTSPFDDSIRRAAFLQIYLHSQLSRYGNQAVPPIHIIVKNGTLILEGVVANESDRSVAGVQANQVSNVFAVVNNLRTENP